MIGYFSIVTLTFMVLLCLQGFLCQQQKLIFVQQVFRHGHRQPIHSSKKDNSSYIDDIKSSGELTKLGMSMHYILGQNLYQFYWGQLFSNTPYITTYNQSKIYVKSTDVNRTIQSVQSQLLGIYQNIDKLTINDRDISYSLPKWPNVERMAGDVFVKSPFFNPIPVHVEKGYITPWDKGDFLRTYSSQFCPNQKVWSTQNRKNPQLLKIVKDQNFTEALKAAKSALNTTITFWDLYKFYDNSVCMSYEGRQVNPIWTTQNATKNAFDAIYSLQLYMDLFSQEKQLAVTATGYFNETYNHFKRVTADQSGVQWAFYSAHDTTVANFIARLNLTNVGCQYDAFLKGIRKDIDSPDCIVEYPAYTSNLIFEVYKYSNKTFTFKIRYNGELRKIPFCGMNLQCPVDTFYIWFDSWKVEDVAKECGIVNEVQEPTKSYFTVAVVEFAIIIVFCIVMLYRYMNQKKNGSEDGKRDAIVSKKDEKSTINSERPPGNFKEQIMRDSLMSET